MSRTLISRTLFITLLLATPALAQDVHVHVNPAVTTGIEGPLDFPTIQNALDHHPFAPAGFRVVIEIAPATYHERLDITQNHQDITLLGKGLRPEDTVITNALNAKQAGGTFFTETVEINGNGFEADNLRIENTAGNTGQAVAAAVRADRAVFKHVHFLGHQDTLFADYGRQYYLDCFITGGVDFIFGNATAVFDHTHLESNGPGYLTAQSRTGADQTTGYVILNSTVTASFEPAAIPAGAPGATSTAAARNMVGLGRPWRPYSRVVYLNTVLPAQINPAGWDHWGKASNEATAFYAEYQSTGPGASPATRAPWAHTLTAQQAAQFLPANFLAGADHWNAEGEAAKLP